MKTIKFFIALLLLGFTACEPPVIFTEPQPNEEEDLKEIPEITLSKNEHKAFAWCTPKEALALPLVLDEDYCMKHFYKISD